MAAISITNLSKKYDKVTAVAGISLDIREGEIFGLLGPNGAGKTTTISILATIVKPTSGHAVVNGFDVVRQPLEVRKSIGIVFQEPSTDTLLTGRENLEFHAMLYGVPAGERRKRIGEVLDLVGMNERADDLVKTYSGGMRRRIEMSRGLLHYPKALFLDEPTLGLDPQTRMVVWKYVERLARKMRITVILTTHYMEEAEQLCDRVAIVDHGRIIALDTPANLKKKIGGDVVIIETREPDAEKRIRRLGFVRKVRRTDGRLMVTVGDSEKDLQRLLGAVGRIESAEVHKTSLNDVFLSYTGRHIREETEGGG